MSIDLLNLISESKCVSSLLEKKGSFVVDDTIGISLLFAGLFKKKHGKYHVVASNLYNASKIANMLASLIGEDNVILFPTDDLLHSNYVSSSKEILSQKIYALYQLSKKKNFILVSHVSSLLTPLTPSREFFDSIINIKVGQEIKLDILKEKLAENGYLFVSKIDQSLQAASRGDILDIFSINYDKPIRIEFFGDEIDCIHYFDIASQSSLDSLDEITILPASDLLIDNAELNSFKNNVKSELDKLSKSLSFDEFEILNANVNNDVDKILSRTYSPSTYKYYQYIKKQPGDFFDYFKADLTFIVNQKQFDVTANFIFTEALKYLDNSFKNGKILPSLKLYFDKDIIYKKATNLLFGNEFKESNNDIIFNINAVTLSKASITNLKAVIDSFLLQNEKVIISISTKQQFETIKKELTNAKLEFEIVKNLEVPNGKIGLTMYSIEEGFELVDYKFVYLCSNNLFGYQNTSSRFAQRYKEATVIKNYDDLSPGDYLVHEQYGIGKFIDIHTEKVNGTNIDYLYIEYADDEVLYIPLSQFSSIRKYAGKEGAEPKLTNLSNNSWEKTKSHIKERINLLADRLYQLYCERAQNPGFSFQKDDELQKDFENEFPYELTADQKQSLNEIKTDMESDVAMDRLLCGDVGFGKTEVAFRAIFKAISSGKQAVLLCPTTLLARQHYMNAIERFRNFDVKIAHISRLVSLKKQKEYIKGIKDGSIHLIIGTHRVLNKEFVFNNLGFLVIDEEQRFGVEQKEIIKELKNNIDVLALSATPIPRTLQLSLIGVRPVSQINTPPLNRSPIQTYVAPYKEDIVRELIERELSRDGQVFYVHNDIASITYTVNNLKRLIPSANIAYIHGKMDKEEGEDIMIQFYAGEIDVLVATSIIENGIDIPNANLIIVENADHFGLAQLYQIKGRVGRGNRIAYAYLFFNENKILSNVASKRLKAIQDFTELGSGYKIAQRDLLIRGAGDILGPEQAGFIDSIGLDLYLKMLSEIMDEKKNGIVHVESKEVTFFNIDAYIPDGYASKEDKMQLYQLIGNSKDFAELSNVHKQIRDMYGRMPNEVELLFEKRRLDIKLSSSCFESVKEAGQDLVLSLSSSFSSINGIGNSLFVILEPFLDKVRVTYVHKNLKIRFAKKDNWFKFLETLVDIIIELSNKYKNRKKIDEN